ncbi:MAG: glycosyltransferase [Gammaproteobacteria bacterium]|nr:glycosyltransferase [Gammaproteobacteria bacterium]
MKILHVIDSGGLYGAERMLLSLATQCCRLGHEVTVATIVAPQDEGDALGEAAVNRGLRHRQFLMSDGLNLKGAREIQRYADQHGFDIIHAHGYKANILLSLVPGRRRQRMVCTLHGWTSTRKRDRLWWYETLDRLLLRRFDRVVVVSEPMRRVAARHVAPGKLALVPNGIDLPERDHATDAPVPRGRSAANAVRVLAVGRLSHEKGFDRLVEAASILAGDGLDVSVTIAGEGDGRAGLERQIAAYGLADRICLVGYVGNVAALYADADVFVLCSRTEGLPLVLLEAMSHGVPVVATPVGEVPAVLGHGQFGCLLEDGDPQSLAAGIRRTAGSPDTADMASRARQHVRADYSAATMAARYCRVYAESLGDVAGAVR